MAGLGGDGTQDRGGQCNNATVQNKPQFPVGVISLSFDYATSAIYALAAGSRC